MPAFWRLIAIAGRLSSGTRSAYTATLLFERVDLHYAPPATALSPSMDSLDTGRIQWVQPEGLTVMSSCGDSVFAFERSDAAVAVGAVAV